MKPRLENYKYGCYSFGMLSKPWDGIRNLSATFAIVAGGIGVVWYFATLENRVRSLEAQLQAIHLSPGGAAEATAIESACSKLASEYASVVQGKIVGMSAIHDLMEQLHCFEKK